jgi:alcohol dehydrogenase class IV
LSLFRQIEPGVNDKDFTDIVVKARKASSMKGNAIELTHEELLEVLHKAV